MTAHRVIVLDADRRSLHDRTVRHEGVALETFAHWLADLAGGGVSDVAVALEVPRGSHRRHVAGPRVSCLRP